MTRPLKVQDFMLNPPLDKKDEDWKTWTKDYSKRQKEVLRLIKSPKSLFRRALQKMGIQTAFYVQPRDFTDNGIFGDYGIDLFIEEFGDDVHVLEKPYIIFEVRVDLEKKRLDSLKDIYLQHGIEKPKDVTNVHRIFEKWFPGEYKWNGKGECRIHLQVK